MQSEIFYADVTLAPGAPFPLPDNHEDRGLYVTQGAVEIAGERFEAGRMMVFRPGDRITVVAGPEGARLMALGGETLNGPRYVWWNFVSSSPDRIESAREAWKAADFAGGPFRLPPGDEAEFIPITPDMDSSLEGVASPAPSVPAHVGGLPSGSVPPPSGISHIFTHVKVGYIFGFSLTETG